MDYPKKPKTNKIMKATFTYKEGPEKHVLSSFWHMQGQIYFKKNQYVLF